jgi:hypothetical protein
MWKLMAAVVVMVSTSILVMENVMWKMAVPILLGMSDAMSVGVGKAWVIHMEKLSFLIENRWGIMLSLILRMMLHLGSSSIGDGWSSLVCLALWWVVRLGTLLIHHTGSIMLWLLVNLMKMFMMAFFFAIVTLWPMSTMLVRWGTRLLVTRMVIHMGGAGRRS